MLHAYTNEVIIERYHTCAGAEGKVDESLAVLAEVETLKTKKKEAEVI